MSEIRVDTISEKTTANGVSIDSVTLKDGGATLSDNLLFNASGKGVYLGTTTATASNLLDDYEEGTWTPVVTGRSTAGTGTYSRQNGYYTKIGNMVRVHIDLVLTAHTGTGGFVISLPFASEGTLGNNPVFAVSGATLTFSNQLFVAVDRNASSCGLYGMSSGASITTINIDGSCDINVTGTYMV